MTQQITPITPAWEFVPDAVMGGLSRGQISQEPVKGAPATRLTGEVSLENNGGFLQMAFDFAAGGGAYDASAWTGIAIDLCGNGQRYDLRLRTTDLTRPWQSFRSEFTALSEWTTLQFAFAELEPYRTEATFDPKALRRLGIVAVGRAFDVDVAVRDLWFY